MDLDLWLDRELLERQNRLRQEFWEILGEVGNAIAPTKLLTIHPNSQGIKLTRGNELNGFPYQVLDLVRDFDEQSGLNIRLLNWFGNGFFLFVLIGKNHPKAPGEILQKHGWAISTVPDRWKYAAIVDPSGQLKAPNDLQLKELTYIQWVKPLPLAGSREAVRLQIETEVNNLIDLMLQKMG
ncbi:hypothetical protein PBT90_11680 [Algoriphagus halophytocola]|uniref:Uncharacterized protein n=1 Tax=Algoriphagus halophytocola TaxID=2991499 RepID=A0ABY6MM32_9BACT|nr:MULTISPECIES: hypothetical protein [unclassified Algoriphagus]UZD24044.1 hypothetical protein OM944_05990 [Algoriphagus sp. TR-M5]WBL41416.1 hypothetical protein PBT90_11680 [Algoriphagus sp. TR-M9]